VATGGVTDRPDGHLSSGGVRTLVVLPTYNESANIVKILERVRAALPACGILVVDDGSPDGTAELVESVEDRDLSVLRRPGKAGLGSAYRAGFRWGLERGYDAFVEMDSDFSHDPDALPGLVAPLEQGHEVSIGSRYVPGGSIPNWSWHRHLLSWSGNKYASVVLGLGVEDSTAGFRAYAATVLRRLGLDEVRAEGYGFQIEMTYRAKRVRASIVEVPISFVDRVAGESKMSSWIVIEALGLVSWWGLLRLWDGLVRAGRHRAHHGLEASQGAGGVAAGPQGAGSGSGASSGSGADSGVGGALGNGRVPAGRDPAPSSEYTE
jgi:dolichol-phosphate mannosyltransferase